MVARIRQVNVVLSNALVSVVRSLFRVDSVVLLSVLTALIVWSGATDTGAMCPNGVSRFKHTYWLDGFAIWTNAVLLAADQRHTVRATTMFWEASGPADDSMSSNVAMRGSFIATVVSVGAWSYATCTAISLLGGMLHLLVENTTNASIPP